MIIWFKRDRNFCESLCAWIRLYVNCITFGHPQATLHNLNIFNSDRNIYESSCTWIRLNVNSITFWHPRVTLHTRNVRCIMQNFLCEHTKLWSLDPWICILGTKISEIFWKLYSCEHTKSISLWSDWSICVYSWY